MPMPIEDFADAATIGWRAGRYRRRAGLTQLRTVERLNEVAGVRVSYSWYTKMETGLTLLDSYRVLFALARIFGCGIEDLTGQPYTGGPEPGAEHRHVPAIEAAVTTADVLEYSHGDVFPLQELESTAGRLSTAHINARYARFTADVPELITRLHAAAALGADRDAALRLLARVYHITASMARRLGYTSLAYLAVNRAAEAAGRAGDETLGLFNGWTLAEVHFKAGRTAAAKAVTQRLFHALDSVADPSPTQLCVIGNCHLFLALSAAQAHRDDEVFAHLAEADTIAGRVGTGDLFPYQGLAPLSRVNNAVFRLSTTVELGQPDTALELADGDDTRKATLASLRSSKARSRYLTHLAHARALVGQDDALDALEQAEEQAPEHFRNHPMARETLAHLAAVQAKTRPRRLAAMSDRLNMGIG